MSYLETPNRLARVGAQNAVDRWTEGVCSGVSFMERLSFSFGTVMTFSRPEPHSLNCDCARGS